MKPVTLSIQNFGPFEGKHLLDFRDLKERNLFLITGPTGSGKTTILDAICFALFGELSGDDRSKNEPRSHFTTDENDLTEVTLDFALGPESYRIRRIAKQPGSAHKAYLWRRTGLNRDEDDGEFLAEKIGEIKDQITALIGFNSLQFRQVVMLPQGEFRKVLTADSTTRQDILKNLFQILFYDRIERELQTRKKAREEEKKSLESQKQGQLESVEAESVEELKESTTARDRELKELQETIVKVRARTEAARKALAAGQEADRKLKELSQARQKLAGLEARTEEIESKKQRLGSARSAEGLVPVEENLIKRREEADEASRQQSAAEIALRKARETAGKANSEWEREKEKAGERESAHSEIERLKAMRESTEKLAAALEREKESKKAEQEKAKRLKGLKNQVEVLQTEWNGRKEKLSELRPLAGDEEDRRERLESLEKVAEGLQNLTKIRNDSQTARAALEKAKAQVAHNEEAAEAARRELSGLMRHRQEEQAALIAENLAEGEPCPVCGSTEHPAPAVPGSKPPSEEEIAAQEAKLADAEKALKKAQEKREKQQDETTRLEALLQALEKQLEGKEHDEAKLKAKTEEARSACDNAAAARKKVPELESEIASLEGKLKTLQSQYAEVESEHQKALKAKNEAAAVAREREESLPEQMRLPGSLEKALAEATARYQRLQDALENARKAVEASNQKLAASKTAMETARKRTEETRKLAEAQQKNFASRLEEAGFSSPEHFQAAKKDIARIKELGDEIATFGEELASARDRLAEAKKKAEGVAPPDLEGLQNSLQKAVQDLHESLTRQGTLRGELENLRKLEKLLTDLEKQHREILDDLENGIGPLADAAIGRDPNHMGVSLQRFILRAQLEEVLLNATRRLEIMSRGRYQLRVMEDKIARKRYAGLDLEVVDAFTGRERHVSTLSGGESFLAAFSLALGLAETAQRFSGGMRLDTIFIDEGFGSLDPEALELAMRAIMDLQEEGRLVGMISHVEEMKSQIDARLEVIPQAKGSKTRFVVG